MHIVLRLFVVLPLRYQEWSTATNKHLGAKDGYFYDTHPADVVCKSVGAYGGQIRAAEDGELIYGEGKAMFGFDATPRTVELPASF